MTRSLSISPSGEEVSIICGYLQEDPKAVRGYLGFLQRRTNSENYNFTNWVIRHVLIAPPASLKARVAQIAAPSIASLTRAPMEPKNFTLSLAKGGRLKFVREMALFAAETADLEVLDYALNFPFVKTIASVHALASSSLCNCCRLAALEHLSGKFVPVLAVILRSLDNKDFITSVCGASEKLAEYFNSNGLAIAISAACRGLSAPVPTRRAFEVNAVFGKQPNFSSTLRGFFSKDPHFHMARIKIAALRELLEEDYRLTHIEQVFAVLAHSGDARSVEILLDLEDVSGAKVNLHSLVTDGHLEVLQVILNHPKYRRPIDPKEREKRGAGSGGSSAVAQASKTAAQDEGCVDLSKLIVTAAGADNLEILRLLIRKAKQYCIPIPVLEALQKAIEAQNTDSAQELMQLEAFKNLPTHCYEAVIELIKEATRRECVAIVFLFRDFYHAKLVPFQDFFGKDMSLSLLKLLMECPRFAEIHLDALKLILMENKPHTASILAAYPRFHRLTPEQLNQFSLISVISMEYVDALKALGRLEEISPQTIYDKMLDLVTYTNEISLVRALSQTPQFAKLETSQLARLYKAATRTLSIKHVHISIFINSPRFQDIDLETLGQELVRAVKLVTFQGSDAALCEMYAGLGGYDSDDGFTREHVARSAPLYRQWCSETMKAMIGAPRLRQISAYHLQEFADLAKGIKDETLLQEVNKFLNLMPKDAVLNAMTVIQSALKPI